MNENSRFSSSRGRVGTSSEAMETEPNSKTKHSISHHPVTKKNSWTSLATKTRRLSKKRRTSLLSSSKAKKENENRLPEYNQSYTKSLEDFTLWCNHYLLRSLHREISPDLRTAVGDGVMLINLLESLTSKSIYGVTRQPVTWSQKLDNIHQCFHFLNSEGVRINGISPEDIIEGQLNGILNFFQRLETHFEDARHFGEKSMDENRRKISLLDHGKNGRISSGYHTEDDGYNDGRTTPIIDALPGLLAGSDTNSETDDDVVEPSDIRLHHDENMGKSLPESSSKFSSISQNRHNTPSRFHNSMDEYRNTLDEGTLDNIGYMPSHPSTKARLSPNKTSYDKSNESQSFPEHGNSHQKSTILTSHVKMATPVHAVLLRPKDDHDINIGQENFGNDFTPSDFGIDDSTSVERGSISSTGTPILPDLSSSSSFEDLPLDFSSDASGLPRENFASSTKLSQDPFLEDGSYNSRDIQTQVESLHFMYQKLLTLVDKDSQDGKRKSKWNFPKMSAINLKNKNASKQRTKDMKSVSRRFTRMESHVVTLARSVDHLRAEIRTQADTSQQLDELRVDVNEFKDSIYSNSFQTRHTQRSRDYKDRLHRLQKLKSFFGEEPPMVALLLQRMGYERFIPHFKAEEIGILELPYMTEQRLQNLGIPLGPRLRILEEIQKLQ